MDGVTSIGDPGRRSSALELFGRLQSSDVELLFRLGRERALGTGDVLVTAGQSTDALYVVLAGRLAVLAAVERQELIATCEAGEVIGELGFLDGGPASMTVAALEPGTVLELGAGDLDGAVSDDPGFGVRLYRALGATMSGRSRRRDEVRLSSQRALVADPAARARAGRAAAANLARLRGRQNHPSLLVENRDDYVGIIERGLPASGGHAATIAVVGAGLAGLTAAHELHRAGHRVILLEASHRAGGRCYTLRAPFAPGHYGEAGAMRFPSSHHLLFAHLRRLGIPTRPFSSFNPDGLFMFGGRRRRMADVFADPASTPNRVRKLWKEGIAPLVQRYRVVEQQGGNAWPALVDEYNELTLRDFLVESGWPEDDVAALGLIGLGMGGYGALMNMGFLELFRLSLLGTDDDLHEIVGGADRLPAALLSQPPCDRTPPLATAVRFGSKLRALEQDGTGVRLLVDTAAGPETVAADYALVTIPFPLLRFVEASPRFSPGKQRAISELHYFTSTKIFLQFRSKFWERGPRPCAGMVATDLPIRALYLPQANNDTGDDRGVILASYTWEAEARGWESLAPDDRVREALRQVAVVFPDAASHFEVGASVSWNDPSLYAGGAFAQYGPGQRGVLYSDIVAPEGRIHFAGEHTSFEHGWLEGAIESGLREAVAIHQRAAAEARPPQGDHRL